MNNVLRIDASMRSSNSHSRQLLDYLTSKLDSHASKIEYRDLSEHLPLIDEAWIEANFTEPSERTAEQRATLALSDSLVVELKQANIILIASPIYNFQIPAAFKA